MSIYVGRKEKETSGDIFPKYEVVNEVNERLANESELNLYFSTISVLVSTGFFVLKTKRQGKRETMGFV